MAAVKCHSLGLQQQCSLRRRSVCVGGLALQLSLEKQVESVQKGHGVKIKQDGRIMIYFMKDLMSHSQICLKVRHKFFDKSCYSGLISLTVKGKEQHD